MHCMSHLCEQKCLQRVPKAVKCQIRCPQNVLEENSRQMDRHKKRLVFRTLIGNSEVRAEVHALQSGGDTAPGRQRWACTAPSDT